MDTDGYAPGAQASRGKNDERMKSAITEALTEFARERMMPGYMGIVRTFARLLARSEDRMDKVNDMTGRLIEATDDVKVAYTTHVASLQESRDTSQKANADLVDSNERLVRMLDAANEKIARRDARIEQLEEKYWKLQDDYRRLAESLTGSRNTYTVGCNNGNGGAVDSKLNL